jgi:uncharacterized protein (TIGR00661 family)
MGLQGKKCLFLVQGEGRGHMTQSISMKQILERAGIEVCEVIIGKSNHRQIPQFYYDRIKVPVTVMNSPTIVMDKGHKSAKPLGTFFNTAVHIPQFIKSLKLINDKINEHQPDFIVNFFEPLCGVYKMFYWRKIQVISVAHHFLYNHNGFKMPGGHNGTRLSLKFYVWMTSFGSNKRLALSFYPFRDNVKNSTYVIPPLLRSEVLNHTAQNGNYLLVYLLNSGYMEDIIKWHKENPETELHCFVDKKDMDDTYNYNKNLTFHRLNDKKFLDMMANSKGLVTTAGFESICEAMYMGKPVLMVPVQGHYEQFCNSRDAAYAGAGIFDEKFDIERLLNYIQAHTVNNVEFKKWVEMSQDLILRQIYSALHAGDNVRQLYPQLAADEGNAIQTI